LLQKLISDIIEIVTNIKFESPYLVFYQDINNLSDNLKSAKAIVKTVLIDKERIPQDIPQELLSLVK
jgi:acyl-CoA thioesterase FadM